MSENPTTEDENSDMDECAHEHAEVDLLTGEMSCHCGYHRYMTADEIKREAQFQADMMEAYYRECERTEQDAKVAT